MCRSPHRAQTLGAIAQLSLRPYDANGDDLVFAPAPAARTRSPGRRIDDRLHRLVPRSRLGVVQISHAHRALVAALDERSILPGAQGEANLYRQETAIDRPRLTGRGGPAPGMRRSDPPEAPTNFVNRTA